MKRPDLEKLLWWARRQAIAPTEKLVLIDMVCECQSPYLQIPYSQKRAAQVTGLSRSAVRRAVKRLSELELICDRGNKPMDAHRYVRIWQLDPEREVGSTQNPTVDKEGSTGNPSNGVHTEPHPVDLSTGGVQGEPQLRQNDPQLSTGGVHTEPPIRTTTNISSVQDSYRGFTENPTPGKEGSRENPTPRNGQELSCLANLPPNVHQGLAMLVRIYPPVAGEQSFTQAQGEFNERRRENYTLSQMTEGVKRYAAYIDATGTPPEYTMHLKRFIGPDLHFLKPWDTNGSAKRGRKLSRLERADLALKASRGGER